MDNLERRYLIAEPGLMRELWEEHGKVREQRQEICKPVLDLFEDPCYILTTHNAVTQSECVIGVQFQDRETTDKYRQWTGLKVKVGKKDLKEDITYFVPDIRSKFGKKFDEVMGETTRNLRKIPKFTEWVITKIGIRREVSDPENGRIAWASSGHNVNANFLVISQPFLATSKGIKEMDPIPEGFEEITLAEALRAEDAIKGGGR